MVKHLVRWQLTPRDAHMLRALARCPLTSLDLLKLSQTWEQPFSSLNRVQRRCQELRAVGQLRSWRYATTGQTATAPLYYKVSLEGYRTAVGDEAARPPTKRFLNEIGPGRHHHQRSLSAFIVHTYVVAHAVGLQVLDFHAENTLRIDCGDRPLFPDCTFSLSTPTPFRFHVELDNSTESIWSERSADSLQSKMQRYVLDATLNERPYRVLFVVTGDVSRKQHIVELARSLTIGRRFPLFYVTHLNDYLSHAKALFAPCFTSPRDDKIALLRSQRRHLLSATSMPRLPLVASRSLC